MDLLRGGTSVKEAKKTCGQQPLGQVALKTRAIYKILKQIKDSKTSVDQRKFNLKKSVCTATLITPVAANMEADR